MSGQLVGEVLNAAASLRARKVTESGFHALVAIAEKAGADRTASVRWDHVRAGLYGKSRRTAERAVQELIQAGLIRVTKPGFKNQHGHSRAPVYEILALVDTDNQMSESTRLDTDSQVTESSRVDSAKSVVDSAKSGVGFRHPDVVLDVSFDGSSDVEPRCARHRDPLRFPRPPACHDCGVIREGRKRETAEQAARLADDRAGVRSAIDECTFCDQFGRLDNLEDCPRHPNFRTVRTPA